LAALGPATTASSSSADLIDAVLSAGTKSGYTFAFTAGSGSPSTGYSVVANAVSQGTSGTRGFFTNQSGVIRYNSANGATSASAPLQ
ncbi:MAG TPA: hypothetical protein VMT51_06975, partial [Dongiaceae bacterium]|nr:hypothetical protein [Dongiaceae bacterium]